MSDEHIVSSGSIIQCLPTRLQVIILRRVEEQLPPGREVMVGAVCLCADKIIISSYSGGMFMAERIKGFFGRGILCYLLFSVVSEFGANFFYICSVECTL